MCKNGRHDLIAVWRTPEVCPGEESVVRWCEDCGAVVVDLDMDGRTVRPSGILPMRIPRRETVE